MVMVVLPQRQIIDGGGGEIPALPFVVQDLQGPLIAHGF